MRKLVAFTALLLLAANGFAQRVPASSAPASQPAEPVTMDFPADGVDITLLADIVTRRLHIPILYDETIRGKKVIIRVPMKVPESALMGILQSALRMKQLALVDAEEAGWKQIVPAMNLAGVARTGEAAGDGPVVQVFVLAHNDPSKLIEPLRPFLTQTSGYLQAEPGQKILIVADYPSVLRRVEPLIRKLDSEAPAIDIRFITLKQADATQLATAVTQLLASRETYQWGTGATPGISITADERTNQLAVVAPPSRFTEINELIASLDKAPDFKTHVYKLKTASPDRLDSLIKGLLGPTAKHAYQGVVDADSQSLVVAATEDVHRQIAALLPEMDGAVAEANNPIQFYKLRNTKAADILSTISSLLGESQSVTSDPGAISNQQNPSVAAVSNAGGGTSPSRAAPDAIRAANSPLQASNSLSTSNQTTGRTLGSGAGSDTSSTSGVRYATPVFSPNGTDASSAGVATSVRNHNATVAADANTNSIIVVAPPAVQQMYADLIKRLDERRPQVQIECTIVTLDTSNGFTFGVDIGRLGGFDTSQLLTLSSFGIANADPATGRLTPVAGTGGTFALLSPRIADVVLRALATNARARFVSAPQLLVNDNGKGKLESVAQEPFAVILDASSTQSLTSLGGQASAGTSITVEPHISEADYLQLAYSIELSNFTGAAANGLPPPSQKNAVDSSVTIPDGYTIVVGGLTTKNFSAAVNTIPIIGDIPFLRLLFGTRTRNASDSTLFVFIRPIILRDDKFEDLKYLSGKSLKTASIPGDFPVSHPVLMR